MSWLPGRGTAGGGEKEGEVNFGDVTVSRQLPIELSQQIADQLAGAITSGELSSGEKLPGVRALARLLDVSGATVQKALGRLAERGLVIRNGPRGTFVASPELLERNRGGRRWVHAFLRDMVYFGEVVKGLSGELRRHGFQLAVTDVEELTAEEERREIVASLGHQDTVGLLVAPLVKAAWTGYYEELSVVGLPTVFVESDGGVDVDAVITDNVLGITLAVRHLAGLGHRDIGYVDLRPIAPLQAIRERREGFLKACAALGIDVREENLLTIGRHVEKNVSISRSETIRELRGFLSREDLPTSIACFNDMTAVELWAAADEVGLDIPQDISVVGFDNLPIAQSWAHPLTTLDGKRHQMGVLAARRLVTLIDRKGREGPRKVLVQPEMVVRASTVPPREGASAVKLRARREG